MLPCLSVGSRGKGARYLPLFAGMLANPRDRTCLVALSGRNEAQPRDGERERELPLAEQDIRAIAAGAANATL